MPLIQHVKLPPDVNPHGLLTIRKAAEISGIPMKTLYSWIYDPGYGLRTYKLGRRKIFLKADEFIRWINAHLRMA